MKQPRRLVGSPRRGRRAVLAAVAVLALSACGGGPPLGAAAVVDGRAITEQQVDDFAQVLCSLGGSQGEGGTPSRSARFGALQILLGVQLAEGVAHPESVERASVQAALQQLAASRDLVPERLRVTFDEVVEDYARSQTAILELGRSSLTEGGKKNPTDEQSFTEGERLRAAYAQKADIEVDPRFGTIENGQLKPSNGSLSVPVTELATKASAEQPPPDLASLLPPSQTCS